MKPRKLEEGFGVTEIIHKLVTMIFYLLVQAICTVICLTFCQPRFSDLSKRA